MARDGQAQDSTAFEKKQIKVSGRIKETKQETEMMCVEFSLQALLAYAKEVDPDEALDKVLVLVNIPAEGDKRAPTYIRLVE